MKSVQTQLRNQMLNDAWKYQYSLKVLLVHKMRIVHMTINPIQGRIEEQVKRDLKRP